MSEDKETNESKWAEAFSDTIYHITSPLGLVLIFVFGIIAARLVFGFLEPPETKFYEECISECPFRGHLYLEENELRALSECQSSCNRIALEIAKTKENK